MATPLPEALRRLIEETAYDLAWRGGEDPLHWLSWLAVNAFEVHQTFIVEVADVADCIVENDPAAYEDWAHGLDDEDAPVDPDQREEWLRDQVSDLRLESAWAEAEEAIAQAVGNVCDEAYERGLQARDEQGGPEWEAIDPGWRDLLRPYGVAPPEAEAWAQLFKEDAELAEQFLAAGCSDAQQALAVWHNRLSDVETAGEALRQWQLEHEVDAHEFVTQLLAP